MADLTPLDEKLAEVLGLAQAAQDATRKVAGMEGAENYRSDLERMGDQAVNISMNGKEYLNRPALKPLIDRKSVV